MNEAPSAGGGWYEPRERGKAKRIFGVAFDGQTWANLAYLLLALPLGAVYFTILGAVVTVGGGLLAVLVGVAILGAAMFAWPLVAEFERNMANGMLGTKIAPLRFKQPGEPGIWPLVGARLTSVSTWQSLLYLFLRLPIGIFAFVAGIVGFVLAPFTLTMSLHIINGAAFVVARLTEALLQPWDSSSPYVPATAMHGTSTPPPPDPALASEPAMSESQPADAGPMGASREGQFYERAQRTAASVTDRLQSVTDELSERARAAARAWNQAGQGKPAEASATTATAEREEIPDPGQPEPDDDERDEARREAMARVHVDVVMRQVTVNGEEVELTPKEFDLLALFVQNPARPFSRDELLDRIWRNDYEVTDRTIDTHVQRLRRKLGNAAPVIQTVWGVGYKYQPPK